MNKVLFLSAVLFLGGCATSGKLQLQKCESEKSELQTNLNNRQGVLNLFLVDLKAYRAALSGGKKLQAILDKYNIK